MKIKETDKVEILTLQDNYVDFFGFKENNNIVQRPIPLQPYNDGMILKQPPFAEHGWSSLIKITQGEASNQLLFDFGWSKDGVTKNAELLGVDLSQVDKLALSHGHVDHFGGIKALIKRIGKKNIELVLNPAVFRNPRYGKINEKKKIYQPCLTKEMLEEAGALLQETKETISLINNKLLFLTNIEQKTPFEKGMPDIFYIENGEEKCDDLRDDSAIVSNLKGKGLVIVSGCGHAGIINTIEHARKVTGIDKIHAVIGGFHLTGPEFQHIIEPTIEALKKINPDYIVPTHCTGRKAIAEIEKSMPGKFILNMSGTTLVFSK